MNEVYMKGIARGTTASHPEITPSRPEITPSRPESGQGTTAIVHQDG